MPKLELDHDQLQLVRRELHFSLRADHPIMKAIDRALAEPELHAARDGKWPASPCGGGRYMHSEDGTYRCSVCNKWPEEHK